MTGGASCSIEKCRRSNATIGRAVRLCILNIGATTPMTRALKRRDGSLAAWVEAFRQP